MDTNFPYDVFLSHSSKDKETVRAVAERLRVDRLRVWFDEWVLKPGDSIPAKIEEGLEQSRVLVLCMSANAFGSDWAQLEAGTFRFRDPLNKDRRFIPLRLDDAPVKGSLAQFLYINWLPADFEQEYPKLLEACRIGEPLIEIQNDDEVGWNLARPEEIVIDRDSRHDFPVRTKDTLARRVGMRCSNPACQKSTSGPQSDPNKALNIGVAAHIAAASAGGPRYSSSQSKTERSSIENGIWLCQNCAKLVDSDENRFTVNLLRKWKATAEAKADRSIQSNSPLISTLPESQLPVRASYAGGTSGTHVSLNIFNAGTSPIYLAAWYSEWGDRSANISLECVRGQLPFRLQAQDKYMLVVDLGDRGFTDLKTIGIIDGSNNHYNVSETETAIMVQQAERYSILHKKPDTTELEAQLRECNVDVHAEIETAPRGRKTLIINFTNKSDIPIPLVGARIEWEYDPPRTLPQHPDATGSACEISGGVNLACRTNLSSPVSPSATVQFYVHPDIAGVLVETLLGDVKDKDIAITFGTTTPFGWKANEDEIPSTIREFAQHVVDSQRNDENTSQTGMPRSDPGPSAGTEQIVPTSSREEPGNPDGYEDGTNVLRGTPFLVVTSITEHWYRPDESRISKSWKPSLERLRSRFKEVIDKRRPIACTLVEKRIPAFPEFSDYSNAYPYGRELIQSGGGLHLEPSFLYNPDRLPLFGVFPIRDVNGRPMSNSAGEAFGFRFGLFRQYSLSVEQSNLQEALTMPGPRIFELSTDGAALLYQLPSDVAISLWRNWRCGFSRRDNPDGYLWFDALFELSRQRSPGDLLYSRPMAWFGNGAVGLVGQGLFPRLPDMSHFPGSIPIPEDSGYPVAWRSTLQDVARASVIAIDELLERAG